MFLDNFILYSSYFSVFGSTGVSILDLILTRQVLITWAHSISLWVIFHDLLGEFSFILHPREPEIPVVQGGRILRTKRTYVADPVHSWSPGNSLKSSWYKSALGGWRSWRLVPKGKPATIDTPLGRMGLWNIRSYLF
jgi:hypothetical protein